MTLCPTCGLTCPPDGICEHHAYVFYDEWSRSNRIVCDFVHRKIEPQRVDPEYRERLDAE